MDERPYRQVQWLISSRDFRVHAFHHVHEGAGYLEALCQHTVPPEEIVRASETALSPPRCDKCLIKHGEDLAGGQVQRWHD